ASRGPLSVRHRGRALLPEDYEVMAREASAAVAVSHAFPCRDPAGRETPGWVTLSILPRSQEPRPWPSFGLRQRVRTYVEARMPAEMAAAQRLYVTGPDYVEVGVAATV